MLHLTATDEEDLQGVSAAMQDAVIRFGDVKYLKRGRRFALVANRFVWEALPERERRRTGLAFSGVMAARRSGPKQLTDDTVLSLLAITFAAGAEEPSGVITLTFAGGHSFALDVEAIDATLDDLGPAWSTDMTPSHGDGS